MTTDSIDTRNGTNPTLATVFHLFGYSGPSVWIGVAEDADDALRQLNTQAGSSVGWDRLAWDVVEPPASLRELADLLTLLGDVPDTETLRALDLPVSGGELDLAALPVFGGEEPADTAGVFSWDETHQLVAPNGGWAIEPRADV